MVLSFTSVCGTDFCACVPTLAGEPDLARLFDQAMTSVSELAVGPIVAGYDFRGYSTIVDVGGGHGRLLAAILAATPAAQGVLYDQPQVVVDAPNLLQQHGIDARVRIESGSFWLLISCVMDCPCSFGRSCRWWIWVRETAACSR